MHNGHKHVNKQNAVGITSKLNIHLNVRSQFRHINCIHFATAHEKHGTHIKCTPKLLSFFAQRCIIAQEQRYTICETIDKLTQIQTVYNSQPHMRNTTHKLNTLRYCSALCSAMHYRTRATI